MSRTTAIRLGITAPVTPLLMKVRRLSAGQPAAWLTAEANRRGFRAVVAVQPPPGNGDGASLTDEELVLAFLLPGMEDEPQTLRLAAQVISRNAVSVSRLIAIARQECALRLLAALAGQALKVAPDHPAWRQIAAATADEAPLSDTLIHWTRLAEPVMKYRGTHSGEWRLVA